MKGYVIYTGELYKDAEAALKAAGVTMKAKCGESVSLVAVGVNRDARKEKYKQLAKENGWDADADLYAVGVQNLKTFCNYFWFDASRYIVKNPPKDVPQLKPISAAELCAEPVPTKSKNSAANDIILAIDSAIECRNIASYRVMDGIVKAIDNHSDFCEKWFHAINGALSDCAGGIIDAFEKPFGIHAKNFVRYSEEARAGFKTLEVIAESSIEAVELLKKIDAKLDRLDTRQEEMNERLSGLAQIETGISANVAKTVTFVDRFTKR